MLKLTTMVSSFRVLLLMLHRGEAFGVFERIENRLCLGTSGKNCVNANLILSADIRVRTRDGPWGLLDGCRTGPGQ